MFHYADSVTEQLGNILGLQAYQSLCTCPRTISVFSSTISTGGRIWQRRCSQNCKSQPVHKKNM